MLRRASLTVLLVVLVPATVQAFDHHHHHSSSSHGDGCSSSSTSSSSHPSSSTPTAAPSSTSNHKRVFVTSTRYSGALGSVQAADADCQSSAAAAGLPGVFRAWLSDAAMSASDRTADVGPWYTTGDALAFSSKADLGGGPKSELLDESGGYPEVSVLAGAWSGSDATGAATGQDCEGWTNATSDVSATTGTALDADAAWGGGSTPLRCNATAPLICLQQ